MSVTLTMNMKQSFFDRQAVIDAIERAEHRAMSKGLAHIRTSARTRVLRRRKKASSPGSPPSVHSTDRVATLKNILFAYDRRMNSGVVGPLKLNQREQDWITSGSTTVPAILEGGGVVAIHEVAQKWAIEKYGQSAWRRRDKRRRAKPGDVRRTRRAVYRPRPFMQVALDRTIAENKIQSAWSNVVTG